jgi:hypothetical protein
MTPEMVSLNRALSAAEVGQSGAAEIFEGLAGRPFSGGVRQRDFLSRLHEDARSVIERMARGDGG